MPINWESIFRFTKKNTPRWVILLIDVFIACFSFVFVSFLRFNFSFEPQGIPWLLKATALVALTRLLSFVITGTYRGVIRYTSTQDAVRIFFAISISTLLLLSINFLQYFTSEDSELIIPLSILILDFIVCLSILASARILFKLLYNYYKSSSLPPRHKIIIYGAGESGIITKRTIDRDSKSGYKVVAFIDDDPANDGKMVEGVKIYNPTHGIDQLVHRNKVDEIIFSIQNINPGRRKEIYEALLRLNVKLRNVPPLEKWINGELSINQIQNVKIEDLLERDPIVLDKKAIARQVSGKRILITGASGSIGSEIARQLRQFRPEKIILLDQAESPLYELDLELKEKFKYSDFEVVISDVNDETRMTKIFEHFQPQVVYHAAAYKHVPMMESNPCEAVKTNVAGTKIVAELSVKYGVERFVLVSTDKAVNPSNVMGASKRIAEIFVQSYNNHLVQLGQQHTLFITTRFGNVLGSSGSVIPIFRKQIADGGPITITHPEITRYFMTIPEACQLVLEAGAMGKGGEIFLFDMGESVKIVDLAKKMIRLSGYELGRDIQIVFTGLRPGEKLKEELLNNRETSTPTHHPKILIAKTNNYEFAETLQLIENLLEELKTQDNGKLVAKMKSIVPEFISNNSVYENLDNLASIN